VSNFKDLWNVTDNENKIRSCVMKIIQAGNKAYYANLHLLKYKLISRNSRKQISNTDGTGGDMWQGNMDANIN
jgi:hypothetical protein